MLSKCLVHTFILNAVTTKFDQIMYEIVDDQHISSVGLARELDIPHQLIINHKTVKLKKNLEHIEDHS